jgi:hypothetical protein
MLLTLSVSTISLQEDEMIGSSRYRIYAITDGGHAIASASSEDISPVGFVDVDGTNWTYHGWSFDFPETAGTGFLTLPDGQDAITFSLTMNVERWTWDMPGPVSSEVTQPSLDVFETGGFTTADIRSDNVVGSWTLRGPQSLATAPFDIPTRAQSNQAYFNSVRVDPPILNSSGIRFLGDGAVPLWNGILHDREFDVVLMTTSSGGSATVPEPAAWKLLSIALLALIPIAIKRSMNHAKNATDCQAPTQAA